MASIDDMRHEIAIDKSEIRETASELRAVVGDRVQQAKEIVDPRTYAKQYPWIALGLVVGAGLAVGMTGADRKAAEGLVDGAKKAGDAIGDGAVAAKDAVLNGAIGAKDAIVDRFSGDDREPTVAELEASPKKHGFLGQTKSAINDLFQQGLDEILTDLQMLRK